MGITMEESYRSPGEPLTFIRIMREKEGLLERYLKIVSGLTLHRTGFMCWSIWGKSPPPQVAGLEPDQPPRREMGQWISISGSVDGLLAAPSEREGWVSSSGTSQGWPDKECHVHWARLISDGHSNTPSRQGLERRSST